MQKLSEPRELEELKHRNKYILLHFTTQWCNPCKLSRKLLQSQILQSSNMIVGVQINCDQAEQLVLDFKIQGVPTFILLDKNLKVIHRLMGYLPEKVKLIFKKVQPLTQTL